MTRETDIANKLKIIIEIVCSVHKKKKNHRIRSPKSTVNIEKKKKTLLGKIRYF